MKKLFLLMTALVLTFILFTVTASAAVVKTGSCGTKLRYSLDDAGTLTISGTGDMENWSDYSSVPWYSKRSSIKNVVISDGVTNINRYAFYDCRSLTSIEMPSSVTFIGSYAFFFCSSLTSVEMPLSVTSIGSYAFNNCRSLTSIEIPSGVTSIGERAFVNCSSLTSITVNSANQNYSSDERGVLFNKGKTTLIQYPVGNTIQSYEIPSGVTSIGKYAFYDCNGLTSIEIPSSVTSIGSYAFNNCRSLTSVTFGENSKLESIGKYAFYNCSSLTSIEIPSSVTSIGDSAFDDCSGLTSVTIGENSKLESISYDAFYNCSSLTMYCMENSVAHTYAKKHTIMYVCMDEGWMPAVSYSGTCGTNLSWKLYENFILEISGTGAMPNWSSSSSIPWYSNSDSIKKVIISDGVTSIGERAFVNCSSLASITVDSANQNYSSDERGVLFNKDKTTLIQYPVGNTSQSYEIPSGVTSIGDYAFYDCSSLTSIEIPSGVTSIGDDAFNETGYYDNLSNWENDVLYIDNHLIEAKTSISGAYAIKSGTKTIADYAFSYCSSLTSIEIPSGVTSIGDRAFYFCYSLTSVTFGENSKLESIGDYAFYSCDSLTSIEIPSSVTSIGDSAFHYCRGLTSIEIPSSVTSIGDDAFHSCDSLTSVTFGESSKLESIGDAFTYCRSLKSVIFGDNSALKSIDGATFSGCDSLTSVIFGDNSALKSIGVATFIDCSSLTSVSFGENSMLESIGYSAFSGCSNLTSIEIPSSVTSLGVRVKGEDGITIIIGSGVFGECSSLASVTFGENSKLESIDDRAFYNCGNLTSIEIPSSVTSIGDYAFYNCSSLTCIEIPSGATSIGNSAFWGCSSLTSIEIPSSVTSIDYSAFEYCNNPTIYGYSGSYAQTYANNNNIPFVAITEEDTNAVNFRVVEATNPSSVISGAVITINIPGEQSVVLTTDSSGKASAALPEGQLTATVKKSGYISRSIKFTVKGGEQTIPDIGISTTALVQEKVAVSEMELQDIIDAGIDITDPDNQHVYRYDVVLEFEPDDYDINYFFNSKGEFIGYGYYPKPGTTPSVPQKPYDPESPKIPGKDYLPPFIPSGGSTSGGTGGSTGGGSGGGSDTTGPILPPPIKIPDDTGENVTTVYPVNEKFYLIIHGEAKWLKEMYDVEMLIINNSLTDTIEDCTAAIALPKGLSLAAMYEDVGEQSLTQTVELVEQGKTHSVHWYVRGDEEGEYNITGTLDGTLMPFEEEFHHEFELESPIKVYAGSALHMTIFAPEAAYYGEDYNVRIEIENVSHKEIYGFTNSILGIKQCKVTRYSGGNIAEQVFLDQNEKIKNTLDTFAPGDKIVIEISSNILFRSEVILNSLKKLSAETDSLEALIDAYRVIMESTGRIDKAIASFENFHDIAESAVSSETNPERKSALTRLCSSLEAAYDKLTLNDVMAINVINGIKRAWLYDELVTVASGKAPIDIITTQKAKEFADVLDDIVQNDADTAVLFKQLRDAIQTIPMRFILKDVTVVTLSGSTTEIPYSVEVIADTSDTYSEFVNISSNIRELVKKASGSLDIPWFIGAINGRYLGRISVSFDEKAYFAAKSATGKTAYKAWVERSDGTVENGFALACDAEDAEVENGVLTFTGNGYVEVTALDSEDAVLCVEATEGGNIQTYEFALDVAASHTCTTGEWETVIDEDYTSDGLRVKKCSVCNDIIDTEAFRTMYAGDINSDGSLNILDAIFLAQCLASSDITMTEAQREVADVHYDGMVNISDLILLQQHLASPDITLGPGK